LQGFAQNMRIVAHVRDPWSDSLSFLQQRICDGLYESPIWPGYVRTDDLIDIAAAATGMKPTIRLFCRRAPAAGMRSRISCP